RHGVDIWRLNRLINRNPSFVEESLGGVEPQRQITDRLDRVGILPGMLEAAIHPRTRFGAHECDRVVDRGFRYSGIDRCLDDLEDGAVGGRSVIALVTRDEIRLRNSYVLQNDRTAERR